MRMESISSIVAAEFRKVDNSKKEDNNSKSATYSRKADKASLSSDARKTSDTKGSEQVIAARVNSEPDIRTDRVDEVKRKVEQGYYNSSQFADKLADKLISDFGI